MAATVSVNGHITDAQHAVVPVFDHGFLYGEGVYETLRTYHRRPFLLDRHLRRLHASASLIGLTLPADDDRLAAEIDRTLAAAALPGEAYIRILVTRGVGDLTYDPAATPTPTQVIIVKPHVDPPPEVYRDGVRVILAAIVRNHPESVSPRIKSNNLMNSALAMQEALRRGAYEAIMRNYRGELAECAVANLFVVRNGRVLTPPVSDGLLPGITREYLMELGAREGIDVREQSLHDADLFAADEAFLTGTTREIVPIVQVDDRAIGRGVPGPLTRQLHDAFRRSIR